MNLLVIFALCIFVVLGFEEDEFPCGQYFWSGDLQSENDMFVFKCVLPRFQDLEYKELPGNLTAGLMINCTFSLTMWSAETIWPMEISTFNNASLSHLSELKIFQIDKCFFEKLEPDIFRGLTALDIFVLNSRFQKTSGTILSPNLFDFNPLLRFVSITSANIIKVPKELFCKLKFLIYIKWDQNRLLELDNIGCNENNTCCPHLESLYLDSNEVTRVKSKDLRFQNLITLHLSRNKIEHIEKSALDALPNLNFAYFADNLLLEIDENLFTKNQHLIEIDLSDNKLKTIPQNVFRGLTSLTHLWLSRNRIQLNASHPSIFRDLRSLQHLDLSGNLLDKLSSSMWENTRLQTLLVSHNLLNILEDDDLKGLGELEILNLSNNVLTKVSDKTFENLIKMTSIELAYNLLDVIPNFRRNLELQHIDLMGNQIDFIDDNAFEGLTNLIGVRISENKIKSIPEMTFRDAKNIFLINLGDNLIENIQPRTFHQSNQLRYVLLGGNKIRSMNDLFTNVTLFLNLSNNLISKFDFLCINRQLEELDLSHNQIHVIFNPRDDQYNYNLRRFYANYNKLRSFKPFYFPPTTEVIELMYNNISTMTTLSTAYLPKLFNLNLQNNQIQEMTLDKFYPAISQRQIMPEINIYHNPLICSCINAWIKNAQQRAKDRIYPRISGAVSCIPTYRRAFSTAMNLDFDSVPKKYFLCEYDEILLEPAQICPNQCVCYRDDPVVQNIVDCKGVDWINATQIQHSLPSTATIIFLDENKNLSSVSKKLMTVFQRLEALYLNSSGLTSINPVFLSSCPTLRELYLHANNLTEIRGTEFNLLPELITLHLHDNQISWISETAFTALKRLTELTLNKNLLHQPQLWDVGLTTLRLISLGENPIHCDCNYTLTFQKWISANQLIQLTDLDDVICYGINTPIIEFNDSSCYPFITNSAQTTIVISTTVSIFTFLLILIVLIYLYRLEMQVWLYSRYGVRIFRRNIDVADQDKIYDAFVSYSNSDDEWVANELVPNLNEYKLCLHQRDFPVGAYISDSIVDAVENSRRTVLILTPSFVESEWCLFEFKSAHLQCLKDRCNRLVIVILEKVKLDEVDKELRAYLTTNTYLDCEDKRLWQKLKFAMPDLKIKVEAGAETEF